MKKVNRGKGEGPNEVDVLVGQKLRELRMLAGLSQSDLAATIGLTFQQLQKYERGVNRVSASKLYLLARHLNVPVSTFFVDLDGQEAGGRHASRGDASGEGEDGDVPIRSREALILARNFQRIKEPKARAALKAFFEACAGMPPSDEAEALPFAGPAEGAKVSNGRGRRGGVAPVETVSMGGRRSRRPRGAIWHPSDIDRS